MQKKGTKFDATIAFGRVNLLEKIKARFQIPGAVGHKAVDHRGDRTQYCIASCRYFKIPVDFGIATLGEVGPPKF